MRQGLESGFKALTLSSNGLLEVFLDLGLLNRLVRHADALTQFRTELSLDLGAQTLGHRVRSVQVTSECRATSVVNEQAKATALVPVANQPLEADNWWIEDLNKEV